MRPLWRDLILLFSLLTVKEVAPSGKSSARKVAKRIMKEVPADKAVVVYGKDKTDFETFANPFLPLEKCKHLTAPSLHSKLGLCSNCMKYCPTRLHSEHILH